ncbi:hypothetical protein [Methylosinus sp. Sm6]|uniref:hypothetical protein n=1 Tax=Methylosinus sp. Sm6 TaxID=2866948 RepID=UPI001C9A03F5|nr:hypothetical protein [Methylosinus sp. Sm6]MBY6239989.1 hypothetical protein [Methylosinus sp. Sm6]
MSEKSVVIHVRFYSDGSVSEIGERPVSLSGQQWFDKLSNTYASDYMALTGGRGAFKLTPEELDSVKAGALQ